MAIEVSVEGGSPMMCTSADAIGFGAVSRCRRFLLVMNCCTAVVRNIQPVSLAEKVRLRMFRKSDRRVLSSLTWNKSGLVAKMRHGSKQVAERRK